MRSLITALATYIDKRIEEAIVSRAAWPREPPKEKVEEREKAWNALWKEVDAMGTAVQPERPEVKPQPELMPGYDSWVRVACNCGKTMNDKVKVSNVANEVTLSCQCGNRVKVTTKRLMKRGG